MKDNKNKFDAFKPADLREWESAAREELNGESPWGKLANKGDGWAIKPYYGPNPSQPDSPLLPVAENEYLGARSWFNCPRIVVHDSKKSNEAALEILQEGADGIYFELNDVPDFNILLENIEIPYCSLNFLVKKNQASIATSLQSFIKEKKPASESLRGAFFGNVVIPSAHTNLFKFSGFQIPTSTNPASDVASGFNALMTAAGKDIGQYIHSVSFSAEIGTDFFVNLAKLRAIRTVWKKFLTERHLPADARLFIHAVSLPWIAEKFEPHGNMLKSTSAAMASILGGCDALTVDAENNDQPMQLRVARNVSNILREESFFSKVADATAGSYFIEDLTEQISTNAWQLIR